MWKGVKGNGIELKGEERVGRSRRK